VKSDGRLSGWVNHELQEINGPKGLGRLNMTLLRKWLLAAMTALVLAAPLAVVSPARADTFDATGQTQYYYLYIRADANSAWELFDVYTDYYQASDDAANARDLGYETYLR
jgi:hypothetical protein